MGRSLTQVIMKEKTPISSGSKVNQDCSVAGLPTSPSFLEFPSASGEPQLEVGESRLSPFPLRGFQPLPQSTGDQSAGCFSTNLRRQIAHPARASE